MRGKTGMQAHTHNRCMARGHMTVAQLVVGENVLPLLYRVSAGLHCASELSDAQYCLEHWREGIGSKQYARTRFYKCSKLASFSGC